MARPRLLPTSAAEEAFAGVSYHLDGELVPVLVVELPRRGGIYFEHHILLWKDSGVAIRLRSMPGALRKIIAGMQIFVTEATGHGEIAFSRDGAGHIFPMQLKAGQGIHVRKHQFLAATTNIDYTFERIRGFKNVFLGGSGFFMDIFYGRTGDGNLWLHGYGNVFERVLGPGEMIDVEPGGWLYKDPEVRMETTWQNMTTGFFAGVNLVMNRFTGPGRVGLQSMYVHHQSKR